METDASPACKRKRSGSNDTDVLKHGEPWFDDGNIVLQAELTQFKIHRGVLSAIFRDMLILPQPSAGEMQAEGCPVVNLPDRAEDWTHVLKALYTRSYHFADDDPFPFSVVAAFLRLGKKYNLTQLYDEAFARLHHQFPSKLEKWENNNLYDRISSHAGLDFNAVNLLREISIPLLLPSAFLSMCQAKLPDILGGVERDDGSLARLSTEDSKILLRGRETLFKHQAESTFNWLCDVDEDAIFADCAKPYKCYVAKKEIVYSLWFPSPVCMAFDPWDESWEAQLCKKCIYQSKRMHYEGRRQMWRELPSIFGLPEWAELAKESKSG